MHARGCAPRNGSDREAEADAEARARGRPVSRRARGAGFCVSVAGDRIDRLERAVLDLVDRHRRIPQVALRVVRDAGADTPLTDTLPRYGVYTFGSVEFASFIAVSSAIVPSYEYGE